MNTRADTFKKAFTIHNDISQPGSDEEKTLFNSIQQRFRQQFEKIFPDKLAPRTVVIIRTFNG